jgi:hypothetical protein
MKDYPPGFIITLLIGIIFLLAAFIAGRITK